MTSAEDSATTPFPVRVARVGFALRKEKAAKHVRPELVEEARTRGIEIVVIDEGRPLEQQGPFDVILQKIRRKEFEEELEAYVERHPEVRLCDPPTATHKLRNRKSMLDVVPREGFRFDESPSSCSYTCTVPNHVVLEEGVGCEGAQKRVASSGLTYPFLAKSLWADGRAGSHDIAVVWSVEGLRQLCAESNSKLPVLLEQYVDHGECLFKVYVLGNQHVLVTRPSLHLETLENDGNESLQSINRVSAYPSSRSWGNASLAPKNHGVPTPPEDVWSGVARRLQDRMGLSLFNFDLIVPKDGDGRSCHLIDVGFERVRRSALSRARPSLATLSLTRFPPDKLLPRHREAAGLKRGRHFIYRVATFVRRWGEERREEPAPGSAASRVVFGWVPPPPTPGPWLIPTGTCPRPATGDRRPAPS